LEKEKEKGRYSTIGEKTLKRKELAVILVTGATGNIGREVVNLLLAGGAKVLAVTRHPQTAVLPDGAVVVGGDPSRP
jgi:NAD(P)-dependent dehydrogenase (short-subunit alcohol dehydrogenase family)